MFGYTRCKALISVNDEHACHLPPTMAGEPRDSPPPKLSTAVHILAHVTLGSVLRPMAAGLLLAVVNS